MKERGILVIPPPFVNIYPINYNHPGAPGDGPGGQNGPGMAYLHILIDECGRAP